jgi:hypothetical protein
MQNYDSIDSYGSSEQTWVGLLTFGLSCTQLYSGLINSDLVSIYIYIYIYICPSFVVIASCDGGSL